MPPLCAFAWGIASAGRKSGEGKPSLWGLIVAVAGLAAARLMQRLAALAHKEIDQGQAGKGIGPPLAKKPVEQQAKKQRQSHIRTGDAACGIGFERRAANAPGDA